mmetsp:Transcript_6771/g.8850  ORF Transcript_6771/g.8850 Transcript_6771/m.8850 type:complete len:99 (+) Transcript_6771:411-707(+)|eukprot:CAMPEP_0176349056 /NCGR_PEP_ID=MMETSP0126-20121128/8364_1 /TAXON_ID=141414 ORGANISM="Strombidinopsis acuminatum, Strain SPMC142" /NCGR_SAMPLE_ID=MMETSP0126 /ASSEMBLY_ACC=CAM_ASM_000229 /LENGTH=98 /DNA_ID=CAMNT_0017698227 /DNA_START=404 /DNA_END=700 /DNA_ORIENTATION=-
MTVKFAYGNTHSMVENPKKARSNKSEVNKHRWVMFVALNTDKDQTAKFVKSVTYHLHPTFKPSVIKVTEAPFLLSRIGWGYFDVEMEIEFKEWTGLKK